METIFVAMSGGIDSSFAAQLLKQQGFRVVGITFELLSDSFRNIRNLKACCSPAIVERARKVAHALQIPHYVIDLTSEFSRYVIDQFISDYKVGRTPNPCVLCNQHIKFSAFIDKAFSMGAEKIATGHYAVIEAGQEGFRLKKGLDPSKDQSYFLYTIKKEFLGSIVFPVGTLTKQSVREWVKQTRWNDATSSESQDICFIPEGDYRAFLSPFVPLKAGPIYSVDGKLMGRHSGIHLYTVGQRRGLKIPFKEPLYVVEIRAQENCLIIGTRECLKKTKLTAAEVNCLRSVSGQVAAKVRYRQKERPCFYSLKGGTLHVDFLDPVDTVAPGQSVVLYDRDAVLCGGVIQDTAL